MLALGTHDGESGRYDDGSDDCLAVWSNLMRKRYFPNPVPDDFYTGNNTPKPHCGLLQDYYAWEWGDALFVVLDPFRNSIRQRGGGDGWGWSLGLAQYQWLEQTLEQSRAKFKFVFIHNLLSGDQASRGGVEVAAFNEWGGKNPDGTRGLQATPPRLGHAGSPIACAQPRRGGLQGARQFLRPAGTRRNCLSNDSPAELCRERPHPRSGELWIQARARFWAIPGIVRVMVSPGQVKVDYIRSCLPQDETAQRKNGAVADRCKLESRVKQNSPRSP